jgi:hypothetical protein
MRLGKEIQALLRSRLTARCGLKAAYGYSDRYPDREQAESRANKECGRNDCVTATWFFGHCGALATSSNGAWGSDQDTSEQKAQSLAQARCTSQGGTNCVILVSHCSP